MAPRLQWMDFARAIAAFWVVGIHISAVPVVHVNAIPSGWWWWALLYEVACRTAVPMFLLISGALLLTKDPWDTQSFLNRRALKLLPPILAWTLLYEGWRVLWHATKFTGQDLARHLLDGLHTPAYPHLWFLWIIAGLYLLAPVFQPFVAHAKRATHLYFAGLWFCMTALAPVFSHFSGIQIGLPLEPATGYIGYFILGASLQKFCPAHLPKPVVLASLLVFCLGGLAAMWGTYVLPQTEGGAANEAMLDPLAGNVILMSLAAFLLLRHFGTKAMAQEGPIAVITTRWVSQISALSFGIYLCHPMVVDVLDWAGLTLDPMPQHPAWYVPFMTLLTFALSIASSSVVRSVRGLKWLMP